MSSNNKKLSLVIEESQKDSGEVIQLFPTLRQTIQPKVLLRLGVFVPTLKSMDKGGRKNHRIDATEPLSRLSIVEGEGYSQIQIYGPRLDMDSDFKSWCGIVYALSNRPLDSEGQLVLNFPEFAKFCGFDTKRIDKQLRERFDASLTRIARTSISFVKKKPGTDDQITINMHLVESTYYDSSTGKIVMDHKTGETATETLTQRELVARLKQHIPEKFFKMVRYFGFLANRVCGEKLPQVYRALGMDKPEPVAKVCYAQMVKQFLSRDPFECVLCGCRMVYRRAIAGLNVSGLKKNARDISLLRYMPA